MRFAAIKNPDWFGTIGSVPPTFIVTNLNDLGPGSLRQAIADATAHPGSTIAFQSGLSGTILLASQLNIPASMIIDGPGSATISVDGNSTVRVLYLQNVGPLTNVTISGLTIANGSGPADGGGILNSGARLAMLQCDVTGNAAVGKGGGLKVDATAIATLTQCNVTGNNAAKGGGVFSAGTLTLVESTVSGNTAPNAPFGNGGGVTAYLADGPTTLRRSTVSGNSAHGAAGVYLYGGSALIENSTVSTNHALGAQAGGISSGNCALVIDLSTIANNDAATSAGGLQVANTDVTMRNSILADNTAPVDNDVSTSLANLNADYSLIEDPGTATIVGAHNITGTDPALGPLANNGGATQTHLPGALSPVIDAGDPAFTPPPATDQRGTGFPRVKGGRVDMGSVER